MKRLFGVLLLLLLSTVILTAQPITEEQARQELDKLGLEEDAVRAKLLERGIDIDNINPNNPAEVLAIEQALEEVIQELEAEKQAAAAVQNESTTDPRTTEAPLVPGSPTIDTLAPEPSQVQVDPTEEAIELIKETDNQAEIVEDIVDAQNDLPASSSIFGQHVFRNKSIKLYRQSEDIKPPDSYVLGVGDIIAVSIWGQSQEGGVYEINKAGYIKPTAMPRIFLKGISYGKAKSLLRQRFGQYYAFRPEEFEVTINYSRTITVNISGEAINYGSFTIPAINTAFNALVAAGGPSDIGSVRKIKLIRAGQQAQNIDIYQYLLNPTESANYYLEENDFIHIPTAERLVEINGAIKRPFRYELIEGENLKQLIEYAGGFQPRAYLGNIQVRRTINGEQVILDIDYNDLQQKNIDFTLLPDDAVTVKIIPEPYDRFTEIQGAVELPGRYAFTPNMRVSDLIQKGQLREGARSDVAYMQRSNLDGTARYVRLDIEVILADPTSPSNLLLQPNDRIIIYSEEQFTEKSTFSVSGAVRSPVTLPYDVSQSIRISDAIVLAGGAIPQVAQYGYVKRTNPLIRSDVRYLRVDVQAILGDTSVQDNFVLEPFDELIVYSQESFEEGATVSIVGAVRSPGNYEYDEELRVSDLIYFSSGLRIDATDFAYIARLDPTTRLHTDYIRVDLAAIQANLQSQENAYLQPFDILTIYSKRTFTDQTTITVAGAVRKPSELPFAAVFTLKDALTLSGGLKMEASKSRIDIFRIDIENDQSTQTIAATLQVDENYDLVSGGDFQLMPYDLIVVRRIPDFEFQQVVTVNGAVKYPGAYSLIADNERLRSVIERAGGIGTEAFPGGATLYRSKDNVGYIIIDLDDVLKDRGAVTNFILHAGDVINIPESQDLVTIAGATRAIELYPDKVLEGGKFNVAFHRGKNAKWYVNEYAAGVGEKGRSRLITVEHANGEIKRTKNFLFFKTYPKVRPGSTITVGVKPVKPKKEREKDERERVNWGKTLADSLAQATAILSLILLVQQIGN